MRFLMGFLQIGGRRSAGDGYAYAVSLDWVTPCGGWGYALRGLGLRPARGRGYALRGVGATRPLCGRGNALRWARGNRGISISPSFPLDPITP